MKYTTTGKLLRRARKQARLKQIELAQVVGMHPTALCHIERGARLPDIAVALTLMLRLQISLPEMQAAVHKDSQADKRRRRSGTEINHTR